MRDHVEIEDIEEMRHREGIEDIELWAEIHRLRVGDFVRLTFQAGTKPRASETLVVRVVRITGSSYRGKLVAGAQSPALSELRPGSLVSFTAANIHSTALESAERPPRRRADPPDKTVRTRSPK